MQALDDAAQMCIISKGPRSNHCRAFVATANQITKQDFEVWDRFHRSNGDIHPGNALTYERTLEKVKSALDVINAQRPIESSRSALGNGSL